MSRRQPLNQAPAFFDVVPLGLRISDSDPEGEPSVELCGRQQATAVGKHVGQDRLVFGVRTAVTEADGRK